MATWKRVVLDGETTSVNLANSDLTQENEDRTYNFGVNALNFSSSSGSGLFMNSSDLTFGSFAFNGNVNLRRSGTSFVLKSAEAELNAATFDVNSSTEVVVDTSQLTMNTDKVDYHLRSNATTSGDGNFTIHQVESTGSDPRPSLILKKDDSGPENGDFVGSVRFDANNDAGLSHTYGRIKGVSADIGAGEEGGRVEIDVSDTGSLVNGLRVQPVPSTGDKADGIIVHGRPLRHIIETYAITFGGGLSIAPNASQTKNLLISDGKEFVVNRKCRLVSLTHAVFKVNGVIPAGSNGLFFRVYVNGASTGFYTNEGNVSANLTLTENLNYAWNAALQLNAGDRVSVVASCSNTGNTTMSLVSATSNLFFSNDYD